MKKIKLILVLVVVLFCTSFLTGCGSMEKIYDNENYESLTNERGDIYVLSGGKIMFEYKGAKILYSSSDTQAMWIITNDGKKVYIQGDTVIDLH